MDTVRMRAGLLGASWTVLCLCGGLVAGVVLGNLVFGALPGHLGDPLRGTLAALPALAGLLGGSALWGRQMGRLAYTRQTRRMAWAGVLGFVPVTLVLGITLQLVEPIAVARFGQQFPLHRLFTLLFVPTAFLIAGIGSAAIGLGLLGRQIAWRLAVRAGLAAALAFLALNVAMEALGWKVGAPGAAERFTMITVMFVGDLGAAAAGGAVIGFSLARQGPPRPGLSHPVA